MTPNVLHHQRPTQACPFCGSFQVRLSQFGENTNYASCEKCYAHGPVRASQDETISAWGCRQPTPSLVEFAEEVRRSGDTRLASMAIAVLASCAA